MMALRSTFGAMRQMCARVELEERSVEATMLPAVEVDLRRNQDENAGA
jgi:hypothetical protein